MDSTHQALRLVPADAGAGASTRTSAGTVMGTGTGRPYAEPVGRHGGHIGRRGGHPPIYAQLVAEWRAKGRLVPEPREVLWATFAVPVPEKPEKPEKEDDGPVPAIPVPRGLPGW
ncbi:hypothetical protein ABZX90_05695 [Streptomyces sp. NPDC002935]|uniref:hypothetical protein n=1 Tax=unclassified Streptomyces TaxID=2593676 RepID=UPI003324B35B